MKHTLKTLTLTIALLFSTPAWAEWELFASGPIAEVYMDLNSIRIKDGYVFHWELINWKKPTERFHSLKMYRQSDCDLRRQNITNCYVFATYGCWKSN